MKLACADFTFPLLEHDRVLDLIAMLEFDGVDIGLFEGRSHLWPSREFENTERSARRLGEKLAERGLRAADVYLQTNPDFVPYAINHPKPLRRRRARDWFSHTLDYAAGCGAAHVSALPGTYFSAESKAASWNRACDELAWRVERAAAQGIVFGIEGHIGSIVPNPRQLARLLDGVPGLTLTLDYTHFTRVGVPDATVEPLIRQATHFHARGARKGRLQTSFQASTIDYARVVAAMRSTGYQGYVGIEYVWTEWERCNEVDNLSETIRFRDFFRSMARAGKGV
jgi:sugar phosphate isomerase/epimerase